MSDYQEFLRRKTQLGGEHGFEPVFMPDFLFGFQRSLVEWSARKGRAALLCDCGLGKTPMQLVWAENVVRMTNKPVIIFTPLAVSYQTESEGAKFGIDVKRSVGGSHKAGVIVTNYEKRTHFDPDEFGGVVCDESSILKNFDGSTRKDITEFMRRVQYRLLCTATAAPNDYHELGTSSDALGYLGARDMLTTYFKEDVAKDHLGWGRKTYRFRGHAEVPFFRWVCSWARACRRPSDLGFSNDGFQLPELIETTRKVEYSTPRSGMLFSIPATGLAEQREERRITIQERCQTVAEVVAGHDGASVVWCHLNPEGDTLEKMIPGSVQVSGSMSEDAKEERLLGFQKGTIKCLITKPKIGCFGLNWQHCSNVVTFPSHSWEQYYQAVRRCWRFGQKNPVKVTIVTTEGEHDVMKNLQRKANQADRMFDLLVENMNQAIKVDRGIEHNQSQRLPSWV